MPFARVIKPGLQTTVQDMGRWGFQSRGVPVAGPMDPWSHRVANALVGNRPDAAALEITYVGPELAFDDDRVVAIAGADFELHVDGQVAGSGVPVKVKAGLQLRFGSRRLGVRVYLAISGGVTCPAVFNSRATHVATRMGGIDGRALVAGDSIPLGDSAASVRLNPDITYSPFMHCGPVRVLPGADVDRFDSNALSVVQSKPYKITPESNRMGYRLSGAPILQTSAAAMISDATPLGAIQVPVSGQPILLMADRQTVGGYPIIATVIAADIGVAGQLGPGDSISFEVVTPDAALAALREREAAIDAIEGRRGES
jgi:antagonist of KipI